MKYSAVLIHGLHVQANGWESLVWGDLALEIWGNIPRGVQWAWQNQAACIYWGSGASERDGKKECEVMYQRALDGISDLAKICGTAERVLKDFLESRSILDSEAKDTNTEIQNCFNLCLEKGITDVVLVPQASQAPLAVRRAMQFALEDKAFSLFRHHVIVVPSDTTYVGMLMKDIAIFTPPHRGDRVLNPSHLLARRTLDIIQRYSKAGDKDGVEAILKAWDMFLKAFEL